MTDMKAPETEAHSAQRQDKQLRGIALESVLEKRRLDQALNAKEFAVCAVFLTPRHGTGFICPAFPHFTASSSGRILSTGARIKMDLATRLKAFRDPMLSKQRLASRLCAASILLEAR